MLTTDYILENFPSPVSLEYAKALDETESWTDRTNACNRVFEFGIRSFVLGILSNYAQKDIEKIYDINLKMMLNQLSKSELRYWISLFDAAMNTYHGRRERFFVVELYDRYWDEADISLRRAISEMAQQRNQYFVLYKDDQIDEAFYKETRDKLNTLLECVKFFADYELIHITAIDNNGLVTYVAYRGINPAIVSEHFENNFPIQLGSVYLLDGAGQMLPLNPFFASYPADFTIDEIDRFQVDIGLLYLFFREDLNAIYHLIINGEPKETSKNLDSLEQMYTRLEHAVGVENPDTRKDFTWNNLRTLAQRLSSDQMKTASEKYDPDTYLNREAVDNAFTNFLKESATGFVLIGKSGVGKTNFVVAQIGEKLDTDDSTIAFLFDGGSSESKDILQHIYDVVEESIDIRMSEYNGETFLTQLEELAQEQNRVILFVVDAINENENASGLMETLNHWIKFSYNNDLRHIKFVITSRPQAWRNIRLSTKIDSVGYYKPKGSSDLTVELEGFGVSLIHFDARSELGRVYEQYAQKYNVKTPLKMLPQNVHMDLCDPLILKLVMRTYGDPSRDVRDREIPKTITSHEILKDYLEYLRKNKIVRPRDFRLLTDDLVPIMSSGNYQNYIRRYDLITQYGKDFVEFIFNDDEVTLSDGEIRKVNQSFDNLLNAEILIVQTSGGTGYDDEIHFKYERFYDYYVSRHLEHEQEGKSDTERKEKFIDLASTLNKTPYLWGPLSQWLLRECMAGYTDLVISLAFTPTSGLLELVQSTLISFGQLHDSQGAYKGKTEEICLAILDMTSKSASDELTDEQAQAVTIVLNVAHDLRLEKVLLQGMLSTVDFVLDATADIIIKMWQKTDNSDSHDIDVAITVATEAAHKISLLRPKRFLKVFRSVAIICLAVFLNEYKLRLVDKPHWDKTSTAIMDIVNRLLRKIPGLNFGRRVRRFILRQVTAFAVYLASQVNLLVFDLSAIEDFFELSPDEREKYRIFVDYLGRDNVDETLDALRQPSRDVLYNRQLLVAYMNTLPYFSLTQHDSDRVNQELTDLFNYGFSHIEPTQSADNLTASVMLATHLMTLRNTLIETHNIKATREKLDNFKSVSANCEKLFWSRYATTTGERKWADIVCYYHFANHLGIDPDFDWLRDMIQDRLERSEVDAALEYFIGEVLVVGHHPVLSTPELIADVYSILFDMLPAEKVEQYRDSIINRLIKTKMVAEYELLNTLQDLPIPEDIKRIVRSGKPNFSIGDNVGIAGAWFIRDIMLDEDETMRKYFQWFFYTALEAKDEREWLIPSMNIIIDGVVTGEFPDPDDLLKPYKKAD